MVYYVVTLVYNRQGNYVAPVMYVFYKCGQTEDLRPQRLIRKGWKVGHWLLFEFKRSQEPKTK